MGGKKKSLCTNPVSYKTSRAGHKGRAGSGHPWAGGRVPGGLGRERRGLPYRRGLIVLMGGVRKARQKSGAWGAGQASAFSTRAQCWRGHGATACPPLALGEPAAHEPLARQAPSGTRTTAAPPAAIPVPRGPPASLLRTWGSAAPHSPATRCSPPTSGPGRPGEQQGGERVCKDGWSSCYPH